MKKQNNEPKNKNQTNAGAQNRTTGVSASRINKCIFYYQYNIICVFLIYAFFKVRLARRKICASAVKFKTVISVVLYSNLQNLVLQSTSSIHQRPYPFRLPPLFLISSLILCICYTPNIIIVNNLTVPNIGSARTHASSRPSKVSLKNL